MRPALNFALLLLLAAPLYAQEDTVHGRMVALIRTTTDQAEASQILNIAVAAHDASVMLAGLQNPDKGVQALATKIIRKLSRDLSAPLWMEALNTDSLWSDPAVDKGTLSEMLKAGVREDYGVDATGVNLSDTAQRADLERKVLRAFHAAQGKAGTGMPIPANP